MRTRPAGEEAAGVGMGRGRVGEEAGRAPPCLGEGAVSRRVPDVEGGLGALCAEAASLSGLREGLSELD